MPYFFILFADYLTLLPIFIVCLKISKRKMGNSQEYFLIIRKTISTFLLWVSLNCLFSNGKMDLMFLFCWVWWIICLTHLVSLLIPTQVDDVTWTLRTLAWLTLNTLRLAWIYSRDNMTDSKKVWSQLDHTSRVNGALW